MGRVGVEEAAAVVAQLLDGFLRGDRSEGDHLRRTLESVNGDRAREGLDHALGDEEQRRDEGDRQQDVEDAASHVDPEVADRRRRPAGQATSQGDRHGDAAGGRSEVADGEPDHLAQVGHGRLARVVLPVRVGVEADGGVVGEVGRNGRQAGHAALAERQVSLEPLLQVKGEDADKRKQDHRDRVGSPALLDRLVDAHDLVDAALDRPDHR